MPVLASSEHVTHRRRDADDDMWLSMWSPWDLEEFPDLGAALGAPS